MTRILVFYPSNQRTVQLETTILAIHRRGIHIELLTLGPRGPLHEALEVQGIRTTSHSIESSSRVIYYIRRILYLAKFCRRRKITAVFSNLQEANILAVFAQFLVRARVVVFRHHFKFAFPEDGVSLPRSRTEGIFDAIINRLARRIVVPSWGVYNGMRDVEHTPMSKVVVLPYIYDFEQYATPDAGAVQVLRQRYSARLILLMSSRLIPFKRHMLVFRVVRDLLHEGLDLRLLVLDDGPERPSLEEFIESNGLSREIKMLGYQQNVPDYLAAADLLIHPSLTEASSSVIKEVALVGKTAVVCQGVGDFDEYIRDGENAFVVPRGTDGSEIAEIVRSVYTAPEVLESLGTALRAAVLARFSVSHETVDRYIALAEAG